MGSDVKTFDLLGILEAVQGYERRITLALSYSGIRIPQYRVITILEKSGKMTVSDLSRQLNVSRATMSVLVNGLITAGLVQSIDNSIDKRSFYLRLTDAGLERLSHARTAIELVEDKIAKLLSEPSIQALNEFANQIHRSRRL